MTPPMPLFHQRDISEIERTSKLQIVYTKVSLDLKLHLKTIRKE